jgi:glycosyltransferase involved in cell wall biosynthesis
LIKGLLAMPAPRITALVCTRNGARTIASALEALKAQTGLAPSDLEIIVVDNGSTDATPKIVADRLASSPFECRFFDAPKEGKVNALIAGLAASRAELVCIVDDDNIVCDTFMQTAIGFMADHPDVGLIGGENVLDGDEPPPRWFAAVKDFFACGLPYYIEPPAEVGAYRAVSPFALIPGAGCTFRRTVLATLLDDGFVFLNETFRGRKMAVTGEDRELSVLFHYFGWKMGHDTRMKLRHAVDRSRLTPDYLARLCQSIGAGNEGSNLLEAQREGRLDHWKQAWWWRALRRCKRLCELAPAQLARTLRGDVDFGFAEWNMELGGLRRCLTDRDSLLKKARERADKGWARRQDVRVAGAASDSQAQIA